MCSHRKTICSLHQKKRARYDGCFFCSTQEFAFIPTMAISLEILVLTAFADIEVARRGNHSRTDLGLLRREAAYPVLRS